MTSSRIWPVIAAGSVMVVLAAIAGHRDGGLADLGLGSVGLVLPALWCAAMLVSRDPRTVASALVIAAGIAVALTDAAGGMVLGGHALAGAVGGWTLGRRWPVLPALALSGAMLIPGLVLGLGGTSYPDAVAEAKDELRRQIEAGPLAEIAPEDQATTRAVLDDALDGTMTVVRRFWPALLAGGFMIQAALFLVCGRGLARLIDPTVPQPTAWSFHRWRAPFASVWVLIGGLALSLVGSGGAAMIGWNVVLAAAVLLMVQGLAVQFWLIRQALPPAGQILFWVVGVALFAPVVMGGGALVGLVDQWWDLRRLQRPDTTDDDKT